MVVSLRRASGGICTLWNSNELELEASKQMQHWIYMNLVSKETRKHYHLFNIYVPMHYKEKEECWQALMSGRNSIGMGNIIIA